MQTPMFRNIEKTMSDSSKNVHNNEKCTMALSLALRSSLPTTDYNINHLSPSFIHVVFSFLSTSTLLLLISSEASFLISGFDTLLDSSCKLRKHAPPWFRIPALALQPDRWKCEQSRNRTPQWPSNSFCDGDNFLDHRTQCYGHPT